MGHFVLFFIYFLLQRAFIRAHESASYFFLVCETGDFGGWVGKKRKRRKRQWSRKVWQKDSAGGQPVIHTRQLWRPRCNRKRKSLRHYVAFKTLVTEESLKEFLPAPHLSQANNLPPIHVFLIIPLWNVSWPFSPLHFKDRTTVSPLPSAQISSLLCRFQI